VNILTIYCLLEEDKAVMENWGLNISGSGVDWL